MVPWIQVYSNVLTHAKTYELAQKLNIKNYAAVGLMVSLWSWCAINAPDGDITKYPPKAIVDATGFEASSSRKVENFYKILLEVRIISKEKNKILIRNWDKYAVLLQETIDKQKKKTAERVRRYRENKKANEATDAVDYDVTLHESDVTLQTNINSFDPEECNVTETLCNGSTVPNLTVPNLTYSDDDGDVARAREDTESENVEKNPDELFMTFFGKYPTDHERDHCQTILDRRDHSVVVHAFQAASNTDNKNFAYVLGVLNNYQHRGVKDIGDVAMDDIRHDEAKRRFAKA